MSYIRTKDGVYEVKEKSTGFYIVLFEKVLTRTILNEDVIKESEDLTELCDEFVIDWLPTNHKDIFGIDKYSKEVIESCIGNNKTNVYGAIWTSKGLIYVAKMNENGDLELI